MPITGNAAITKFVTNRALGDRLIVKCGEIFLVKKEKISFWQGFKAFFGRGSASLKKVAEHVHQNRDVLFPEEEGRDSIIHKHRFNTFIRGYNQKHRAIQKAREVGDIEAETITFFGKEWWARVGIDVSDAPPEPDLKAISQTPCGIWKRYSLGHTHMIVLIPKTLDLKPLTSNRLNKFAAPFFNDPYGFHRYKKILSRVHDDIPRSYYVMMTKDVLPDSLIDNDVPPKPDSYKVYSKLIPEGYRIPNLIEGHVCMLSQYLRGKALTNKSTFLFHKKFTRCYAGCNLDGLAGYCDEKGFTLSHPRGGSAGNIGLAVLKSL